MAPTLPDMIRGQYVASLAESPAEVAEAQELRARCFATHGPDRDDFDPVCTHVLIRDLRSGRLICCFRMLFLQSGGGVGACYSAQFYGLEALSHYRGPMAELGRFCIDPAAQGPAGRSDPDILRLAWAVMTRLVDDTGVEMLFGCASFAGTRTESYLDAFAMLKARHLAPKRWLPRVKAPEIFRYAARLRRTPDLKAAMRRMPPLLRTYLTMGGWVSDHAVVDRQMNTLHVFTGVEVSAIPPARKQVLRALAG
ncbi:MAG: GNAT family N-acetyltransferase [Marinibacterium sp.]